MPIVELHVIEGYDADAKQRLAAALTDAVRLVVPAAPELVTVMIRDMRTEDYYRGRTTRSPAQALPNPVGIVRDFLAAMERRDLDAAEAMLGVGFAMQFPGTAPMTRLQHLIDWAKPRYQFVTKTYDGFDALQGTDEAAIVYCRGTLSGAWPDGTTFSGIRFIDRFEVTAGFITRQDVWNDIAETKANA